MGDHGARPELGDRLELDNFSGRDVVIYDYKGKPYARVLADRTVEVNTNSQAYYLKDDRYGNAGTPAAGRA